MTELRAGIWRHYKGPLYLVLGLAHDANAGELFTFDAVAQDFDPVEEREVVVYIGLQLDAAHAGARLAVRTLADFMAEVCVNTSCDNYGRPTVHGMPRVCHNGGHLWPRFFYVGTRYEPGMEQV